MLITQPNRTRAIELAVALIVAVFSSGAQTTSSSGWPTYGGNQQHTALSPVAAQSFGVIRWSTPVDLAPPAGTILIHYGSPLVTPANTVIIPVKTGSAGGYRVDARSGEDGSLIWSQVTDYILPPHSWIPSYSPALTPDNRVYSAGAGGTVYYRDNADSAGVVPNGQLAFFGMAAYSADPTSYNSTVFINTPITSDSAGNIYFGFRTVGTAPLGLTSGIARIDALGNGTWVSASAASGGIAGIVRVPHQVAPALSNDEETLYVVVLGSTSTSASYLVGLDPETLALKESSPGVPMRIQLKIPRNGSANNALISDNSSSSPMVGPDGDVFYGILGNPSNGSRGWMLHFSGNLLQTKTPGAFGWDSTASVVPATMVPSYGGTSSYLIFTKYNNYAGSDGGDGVNKIAILDPNDTMVEPHPSSNGQLVMKEILKIAGVTPDPAHTASFPNAVVEWCINTAAVDPATGSVIANSEDGKLYRWDLTTNTLSQTITLSPGVLEAYTPTVIGPDGTIYAINQAVLSAVGEGSSPDLVETAVSDPPAAIAPGTSFSVTDTTRNQSSIASPASTTRYYLSLDGAKDAGDTLLTGSKTVPDLDGNESVGGTVNVTIPASTPLATYALLACADDLDAVIESSETNNCLASGATMQVVAGPDSVVPTVTNPPAFARPGDAFQVTDTTKNQGSSAAKSKTRHYLSLDTARSSNDILLGTRSVPGLAALATSVGSTTVTIGSSTPLGLYYLLACADDATDVVETNEANNCLASATTVQVTKPDLIETAISNPPTAVAPGSSFSVTDTAKNQGTIGAGAATTRYYLSLNTTKGSSDILLTGNRPAGTLVAGGTSTGQATVTLPNNTAVASYFLLACADDTTNVTETSETNNCIASSATVQVTRPDLTETAVSNPPANAAAGSSFSVTDTVLNNAPVTAAASTTRYYLSLDAARGGDKQLTGTRAVSTLVAAGTSNGTVTVKIPSKTAAGSYFLLACADDTTNVTETRETNNCRTSANRIIVQ